MVAIPYLVKKKEAAPAIYGFLALALVKVLKQNKTKKNLKTI
jgi:hypothetical protein